MSKIKVNDKEIMFEQNMNINRMNYTFKMIIVKVDGKLIPKNEYETFIVKQGADVKVIHLISGG